MVEPSKLHHERVKDHLRAALHHLEVMNHRAEEALQAHLEAHPVIHVTPPPPASEDEHVVDVP